MTTDAAMPITAQLNALHLALRRLDARELSTTLTAEQHAELLIAVARVGGWLAEHMIAIARDCDESSARAVLEQIRQRRVTLTTTGGSA
jgi:hypothetical protein